MTPTATLTQLQARGAGFQAAEYMHQRGLTTISLLSLYSKIHFGKNPKARRSALERAIATGWLAQTHERDVQLGAPAIAFFSEDQVQSTPYIGKIATSREPLLSVYERPALKYRTNSKGFRDDIPAFSVRDGMSFRSVPTSGSNP